MYVLLTRDPAASAACTRSHSQIRVRPESSEPPEKNVRGGTTSTTHLILSSFYHSLHPLSTLSLSPIFPSYFVSSVTVGSKPKPQDQLRLKSRQGTNIEEEQLRQAPSPSISLPGLRPVFSTKVMIQFSISCLSLTVLSLCRFQCMLFRPQSNPCPDTCCAPWSSRLYCYKSCWMN